MKTTLEILVAARALISDPERWTQYRSARRANGNPVCPTSEKAVCFCADGAVRKYFWDDVMLLHPAIKFLNSAALLLYGSSPIEINDGYFKIPHTTPHQAILNIYDRAIALAGDAV